MFCNGFFYYDIQLSHKCQETPLLAYYNRHTCLETPQLHLLGQDILSQMSNLTFIMYKTYKFDTQGVKNWQKTKKKRSHKGAKMASQ